jgi:hypothetical protein
MLVCHFRCRSAIRGFSASVGLWRIHGLDPAEKPRKNNDSQSLFRTSHLEFADSLGGIMKERDIGVVLLISGGVLCYLCVYQPLESAWRGAPTVSVSLKGAILAPLSLIGLMYLVLGQRATTIMGTREKPTTTAYAIGIGALLLGLALYVWLRSTLQAHGYDFQGRF